MPRSRTKSSAPRLKSSAPIRVRQRRNCGLRLADDDPESRAAHHVLAVGNRERREMPADEGETHPAKDGTSNGDDHEMKMANDEASRRARSNEGSIIRSLVLDSALQRPPGAGLL